MSADLDSSIAAILDELVDEYVNDAISAASLSGSFARGDADCWSDIDLRLYTDDPLEGVEAERLVYRHGRLISISCHTFRGESRQLSDPSSAVFAVHPIRTLRPILDREGSLAELQQDAHAFRWDAIATDADRYAAQVVYRQAEVVHKTLGSLANGLPLRAVITTMELVGELTLAMAIARRLLVVSDRTYLEQVHEAVGETSAWTGFHRLATGIADAPMPSHAYLARGQAALRLYEETAELLGKIMTREQLGVVRQVRELIRKRELV